MTHPLDDLSPAALETLADMIEERLENPESGFEPATWHQTQARQNAARELRQALVEENLLCWPNGDQNEVFRHYTVH
jgi:hypothetical protein